MYIWADKMVQWLKVLVTEPCDLTVIPSWSHVAEGRELMHKALQTYICVHTENK